MEKLRGGAKNLENKHVASGRKHVVRVCTRCSASRCTFGLIAEKWLHRIFLKFCHGRADDVCGRLQNYRKIYGADFPQYVILCCGGGWGESSAHVKSKEMDEKRDPNLDQDYSTLHSDASNE